MKTGRAIAAKAPSAIGLSLLLVFGCVALPGRRTSPPAARGAPQPRVAIWCEFLPYREVEQYLPALQHYDCRLYLHVNPGDIGSPALARVLQRASSHAVEIWLWQLLPYEENLYVGEDTLDRMESFSLALADWVRRESLPVDWIIFDCEPSPALGRRLALSLRNLDPRGMANLLREQIDPQRFARSIGRLNRIIAALHQRGFRVMGCANRIFLDFLARGNTALEDSLNAPFSMVNWDRVSFITYQYTTSHAEYAAMVGRYAQLGRRLFGPEVALDLGLTGDHRLIEQHLERARKFGLAEYYVKFLRGMQRPDELRHAAGIALSRGVRNIHIYSLDGAVNSPEGLSAWLSAACNATPLRGIRAATPVRSIKLGVTAAILNGLYRALVI
ncbi:MAG TPA: hypothetical protein EYP62_08620 [Kiritimatiellae bacterium]|nr:hypothetical protein [Kiritimatiellia bacterium]